MRKLLGFVLVLSLVPSTPADAEEFAACWTGFGLRPGSPTRCSHHPLSASQAERPSTTPQTTLSPRSSPPNLGTDITGQCWYLTSASTDYVVLNQFADGSAEIGFDTDPANPGGIIAIGPTVPRCTSEPVPASDPQADAWNYVMSYIHDPSGPGPESSPRIGGDRTSPLRRCGGSRGPFRNTQQRSKHSRCRHRGFGRDRRLG